MYVDVMYLHNILFMLSVSKPLNILLSSELNNERNGLMLANTLLTNINLLKSHGFTVEIIYCDEE